MVEFKTFNQLPESTPDEIERKAKAYQKFIAGKGFTFLKAMADTQVAQFFIPKTDANKDVLMTDSDYRLILSGYKSWQDRKVAKATAVAVEERIFHWFIEFPEVFSEGGFDCILGNPPFLGGLKISTNFGHLFLNYINCSYKESGGTSDFVSYFFRRCYDIICEIGFLSLIGTNTISQGDTRKTSLENIVNNSGTIVFAYPSIKWPGIANLDVSLISITKYLDFNRKIYIKNREVKNIGFQLEEGISKTPYQIKRNSNKSFIGSFFLGDGFILTEDEKKIIESDFISNEVIFQLLNGNDINENPQQQTIRYIINFEDKEIEEISKYKNAFARILKMVKPIRDLLTDTSSTNLRRKKYWWQYAALANNLYETIFEKESIFVTAQTSKYINFIKIKNQYVYAQSLCVFSYNKYSEIIFLQASFHTDWIGKYGTTLGQTLRYTPSDCFQTFPFPQNLNLQQEQHLETIGETYHEYRKQLMLGMQLGLTKTYNLFHSNAITAQSINEKDKQVIMLRKHLEKTANTISFNEAIQGIIKLRALHVQMDEAVLSTYGWSNYELKITNYDNASKALISNSQLKIDLKHDFYEVDYLPENDRVRYTIHPDARKEVLKRLLELNHKIHEEEVKAGLWDKKGKNGKGGRGGNGTNNNSNDDDDIPDEELGGLFSQQ